MTDERGGEAAVSGGAGPVGEPVGFDHVTFAYAGAGEPSVSDIELSVPSGRVVVLAGPSGCGKTTLCRLLSGLVPSFFEGELAGRVRVGDLDVTGAQSWDVARLVGTVFQNPRTQFFTTDTSSELAFGCENQGLPADEIRRRVSDAVAAHGLRGLLGRSVFALSGGEKQRLACGAVAAMETPVVVLDEPSANLDAPSTAGLREVIATWARSGRTVVVAEHRMHYLRDLADEVVVMESGRIRCHVGGDEFRALGPGEVAALGLRATRLDAASLSRPERAVVETGDGPALELRNVRVRRRPRSVPGQPPSHGRVETLSVDRLGFRAGEVTAVIGPNGAGKSTLASFLAGLGPRQPGTLTLDGRPLSWRQRRRECYLVLQDVSHQLFTESALREVMLALPTSTDDEQAARAALEQVNLADVADRHPLSLSAGQRQRLAIACALVCGREVAIFDEPTSGLDLVQMHAVADALRTLARQGRVVLVATHDVELIASAADAVAELDSGHLRAAYPLDGDGWAAVLRRFAHMEGGE